MGLYVSKSNIETTKCDDITYLASPNVSVCYDIRRLRLSSPQRVSTLLQFYTFIFVDLL